VSRIINHVGRELTNGTGIITKDYGES